MKSKLKFCDGHGDMAVIWKNHKGKRYCKRCWCAQQQSVVKPINKKLPRRSPKRSAQDKEYSSLRASFLLSSSLCTARIPGHCTINATDVHHKKGRAGDLLLDTTYWMPVCRACHTWIDANSQAAEDLGFTIKRST